MILTYHNIGDNKENTWVSLDAFKQQMKQLKDNGYKVVTLDKYDPYNDKHVVIRFDDGRKNILDAISVLKKNKWPFYVFVVGNNIGVSDEFFAESDFNIIKKSGCIIGWHTWSHPDLTTLSKSKIKKELTNPYGFDILAYPHWKTNERVVKIANQLGYKYCCSGNGHADTKYENFALDSVFVQESTDLTYINDKIVKFLDCSIPVKTCNFRCHYCYITQNKWWGEKLPKFKYSPEHIAKALSKQRMGGTCLINMCGGGETMLPPEIVDITRCLLQEGHYVMIVTNGTISKRFDEILSLDKELLKHLFFKFSFQYLELKRTNLMDVFFANVHKVKDSPASFTVELTTVDELVPHIDDIKETCMRELGALCHLTIARDETQPSIPRLSNLTEEQARKIWGSFDSAMFDFKLPLFEKKRTEFCYAGKWSYLVDFGTGTLVQCYGCGLVQNIFEDLETPIRSCPVGKHCPNSHCWNNHAFLCFGDIVNFPAPRFAEIRDRVCKDGSHWLKPEFQNIFNQRLDENNIQFTEKEIREIERKRKKTLLKRIKKLLRIR